MIDDGIANPYSGGKNVYEARLHGAALSVVLVRADDFEEARLYAKRACREDGRSVFSLRCLGAYEECYGRADKSSNDDRPEFADGSKGGGSEEVMAGRKHRFRPNDGGCGGGTKPGTRVCQRCLP